VLQRKARDDAKRRPVEVWSDNYVKIIRGNPGDRIEVIADTWQAAV
jgi:hypothetical protein